MDEVRIRKGKPPEMREGERIIGMSAQRLGPDAYVLPGEGLWTRAVGEHGAEVWRHPTDGGWFYYFDRLGEKGYERLSEEDCEALDRYLQGRIPVAREPDLNLYRHADGQYRGPGVLRVWVDAVGAWRDASAEEVEEWESYPAEKRTMTLGVSGPEGGGMVLSKGGWDRWRGAGHWPGSPSAARPEETGDALPGTSRPPEPYLTEGEEALRRAVDAQKETEAGTVTRIRGGAVVTRLEGYAVYGRWGDGPEQRLAYWSSIHGVYVYVLRGERGGDAIYLPPEDQNALHEYVDRVARRSLEREPEGGRAGGGGGPDVGASPAHVGAPARARVGACGGRRVGVARAALRATLAPEWPVWVPGEVRAFAALLARRPYLRGRAEDQWAWRLITCVGSDPNGIGYLEAYELDDHAEDVTYRVTSTALRVEVRRLARGPVVVESLEDFRRVFGEGPGRLKQWDACEEEFGWPPVGYWARGGFRSRRRVQYWRTLLRVMTGEEYVYAAAWSVIDREDRSRAIGRGEWTGRSRER